MKRQLHMKKKKMARATAHDRATTPATTGTEMEVPNTFSSPESSTIDGATYNRESGHLTVFFRRGAAYDYASVPFAIWVGFVTATSKGEYLNATIRPLYTGVKREDRRLA